MKSPLHELISTDHYLADVEGEFHDFLNVFCTSVDISAFSEYLLSSILIPCIKKLHFLC